MSKLSWVGVVVSFMLLLTVPAWADDPAPSATEWQTVIASQIQAFRDHNAPAAYSFAGDEFHQAYADPKDFFVAIIQSGYSPIMESTSQTFGEFQLLGTDKVLQEVMLTGTDHSTFEAIYQLAKGPDGWRVHGVQLIKTPGLGV